MIRNLLKWVAPGMVTLLAGTIAALAMTTPSMLADLEGQGAALLAGKGLGWAHIAAQGRDIHLQGTTDSEAARDAAMTLLEELRGVRMVSQEVTIAPLARPYLLTILVENGAISLSGHVPNAQLQDYLAQRPDIVSSQLAIRSGQPDETPWLAGVEFALAQAASLDSGTLELSGLSLSLAGRAKSEAALGAMEIALAKRPDGLRLAKVALGPAYVSPYIWQAQFDGARIAISGHVPDAQLVERLRTADISGLPVATGLSLASGEPEGFAELSRLLVEQLARLEYGEAGIIDGVSRISGTPPSYEVAQAITETLSGAGSVVELAPPRISDYWVSLTLQEGGVLVYDGYVPDQKTLDGFAENVNADINFLKLGGGAPAAYHSGVDIGQQLLANMSEGRVTLSGSELSVSGIAADAAAYRAIRQLLDKDFPRNVSLAAADIQPALATKYEFVLRRDEAGKIELTGLVPGPELEESLLAKAGENARASLDYASGEPAGFAADAQQALGLLEFFQEGQISFDGANWLVSGTPGSALDKASIEAEFQVRGLAEAGWELRLAEAVPAASESAAVNAATPAPPEPVAQADEPPPPPASAGLALCRDQVAELSAHNAILFQSGNAIIAASAFAELDRFAAALALCPDTRIDVEGHTDSDGDDRLNLALSVARAEAVVDALVERGVDMTRLYAIGYGESAPVADNATAAGKMQNRRIVVTVHDADE